MGLVNRILGRNMKRARSIGVATACLFAMLVSACAPQPTQPLDKSSFDFEGLQQFDSRVFTALFGRPGTDFTAYDGVILDNVQVAYRTPDRSQNQFPLDESKKGEFRDLVKRTFVAEFENLRNIEVVGQPGPTVLDLHVRVQDITATLPGRRVGQTGRATFALEALGEVTLVLELRDSESEEVLVRVFDQRAVEGVAMFQDGQTISRWPDIERLCQQWALRVREGLDVLVAGDY